MKKIKILLTTTLCLINAGVFSTGHSDFPVAQPHQEANCTISPNLAQEYSLEQSALSKAYGRYAHINLYNFGKRIFSNQGGMPIEIDNIRQFRLHSIKDIKLVLHGKGKALFEISVEFIVNNSYVYAQGYMNEKGEIDVIMTNFLTENPKVSYSHFRHWELIEKGIVRPGMNEAEVILSWGNPLSVKKSTFRGGMYNEWGYPSTYLYFKDGVLNTMQDF